MAATQTKTLSAKAPEPVITRGGPLAHPGRIVFALAGMLIAAYFFNVGGVQTDLDAYLSGLNLTMKSHQGAVTSYFLFALPFLAVLLAGGILYILLSWAGHAMMSPFKEARKKKAKQHAKQAEAALQAASGVKPRAQDPMILIRPARPGCKDLGVASSPSPKA